VKGKKTIHLKKFEELLKEIKKVVRFFGRYTIVHKKIIKKQNHYIFKYSLKK